MPEAQRKAVQNHRRRLKRRGMTRVEVTVGREDVALVRGVAQALGDPKRAGKARRLLHEHLLDEGPKGLKALLASAPLEGVELTRERDFGRDGDP